MQTDTKTLPERERDTGYSDEERWAKEQEQQAIEKMKKKQQEEQQKGGKEGDARVFAKTLGFFGKNRIHPLLLLLIPIVISHAAEAYLRHQIVSLEK